MTRAPRETALDHPSLQRPADSGKAQRRAVQSPATPIWCSTTPCPASMRELRSRHQSDATRASTRQSGRSFWNRPPVTSSDAASESLLRGADPLRRVTLWAVGHHTPQRLRGHRVERRHRPCAGDAVRSPGIGSSCRDIIQLGFMRTLNGRCGLSVDIMEQPPWMASLARWPLVQTAHRSLAVQTQKGAWCSRRGGGTLSDIAHRGGSHATPKPSPDPRAVGGSHCAPSPSRTTATNSP